MKRLSLNVLTPTQRKLHGTGDVPVNNLNIRCNRRKMKSSFDLHKDISCLLRATKITRLVLDSMKVILVLWMTTSLLTDVATVTAFVVLFDPTIGKGVSTMTSNSIVDIHRHISSHISLSVSQSLPRDQSGTQLEMTATWSSSSSGSSTANKFQPDFESDDPYDILGLPSYIVTPPESKELKKLYKFLAMQYHPDMITNMGSTLDEKKVASDQFAKINWAYETLMEASIESSKASTTWSSATSSTKSSSSSTTGRSSGSTTSTNDHSDYGSPYSHASSTTAKDKWKSPFRRACSSFSTSNENKSRRQRREDLHQYKTYPKVSDSVYQAINFDDYKKKGIYDDYSNQFGVHGDSFNNDMASNTKAAAKTSKQQQHWDTYFKSMGFYQRSARARSPRTNVGQQHSSSSSSSATSSPSSTSRTSKDEDFNDHINVNNNGYATKKNDAVVGDSLEEMYWGNTEAANQEHWEKYFKSVGIFEAPNKRSSIPSPPRQPNRDIPLRRERTTRNTIRDSRPRTGTYKAKSTASSSDHQDPFDDFYDMSNYRFEDYDPYDAGEGQVEDIMTQRVSPPCEVYSDMNFDSNSFEAYRNGQAVRESYRTDSGYTASYTEIGLTDHNSDIRGDICNEESNGLHLNPAPPSYSSKQSNVRKPIKTMGFYKRFTTESAHDGWIPLFRRPITNNHNPNPDKMLGHSFNQIDNNQGRAISSNHNGIDSEHSYKDYGYYNSDNEKALSLGRALLEVSDVRNELRNLASSSQDSSNRIVGDYNGIFDGCSYETDDECDIDLFLLLETGSITDISNEIEETDALIQVLITKQQCILDDIVRITTNVKSAISYKARMTLQHELDEYHAKSKILIKYIKDAQKRILALVEKYKRMIIQSNYRRDDESERITNEEEVLDKRSSDFWATVDNHPMNRRSAASFPNFSGGFEA